MSAPLACLHKPLDDIDAALDAFASSPDEVRAMSLSEIAELIKFEQRLRATCDSLKRLIEATENKDVLPERSFGRIDSEDHPVIQKILHRHREAVDRAARIRRQSVQEVKDSFQCRYCMREFASNIEVSGTGLCRSCFEK